MTEFEKLKNKTMINNIIILIGIVLGSPFIILFAFFMTFSSLKLAFNVSSYSKWRDLLWKDYYIIRNIWVLMMVIAMFSGNRVIVILSLVYFIRGLVVNIKDTRNGVM